MKKHVSSATESAAGANAGHPNAWLRELAQIKKTPLDIGHSIRAALTLGLLWAGGIATGAVLLSMLMSLGALNASLAEPGGDYRDRFWTTATTPAIGALGFFAGYLGYLPWSATVAAMAFIGFTAHVLSSYGHQLSVGTMQALILASVALGLQEMAPFWQPALLYLCGVAVYVAILGIEALLLAKRGGYSVASDLVMALGDLAAERAAATTYSGLHQTTIERARRIATQRLAALRAATLRSGIRRFWRRAEADRLATILDRGDATFVAIMASADRSALGAVAEALRSAAGKPIHSLIAEDPLGAALAQLSGSLAAPDGPAPGVMAVAPEGTGAAMPHGLRASLGRMVPSRAVMHSSAVFALCLGIAYTTRWLDSAEHWFWIPLTVSLVMKPDLGSIFTRAVLRVIGTVIGAAIGVAVLAMIPHGVWLAVPIGVLAGVIPIAMRRSYALQAAAITPLILVLLHAISPGGANVDYDINYGLQRILDTVIGGGIVLVLGYFIWPRTHYREVFTDFRHAQQRVAEYLLACASPGAGGVDRRIPALRQAAYQDLAEIRAHLLTALGEPPPASDEALAWVPLIEAAERICDQVTVYTMHAAVPTSPPDAEAIRQLAIYLAATPGERQHRPREHPVGCSAPVITLIDSIEAELQHMDRLLHDPALPAPSRS